jgi:hypothetical protein
VGNTPNLLNTVARTKGARRTMSEISVKQAPTIHTVESELLDACKQMLAMTDRLGRLLPIILDNKAVKRARLAVERAEEQS